MGTKSTQSNWYVYIIEAENGFLYTGITTDIQRRFAEHKASKKGAKFFRSSRALIVKVHLGGLSQSEALKLEARIKKMPRAQKMKVNKKNINKKNIDTL